MPPRPPRRANKRRIKHPNSSRQALSKAFNGSQLLETVALIGLVLFVAIVIWAYQLISSNVGEDNGAGISPQSLPRVLDLQNIQKLGSLRGGDSDAIQNNNNNKEGGLSHFINLAQDLAALSPDETLKSLESDPFGVRAFDTQLLEKETALGRILTIEEIQQIFPCPTNKEDRITLPDMRIESKAQDFRDEKPGTFLFFQHLRKAGGTNFCSLAENNLPKKAQPRYYCMPDMGWSGNKNAGYLHSWSNKEIISRMKSSGFRIAGNEWENFDKRHFDLPAVFATSFRKPLDRALSQFRFECIEDRGCHEKDVHKWWDKRIDLRNVYTKTFADLAAFRGKYSPEERRNFMRIAIDAVSKFHIVLNMEWLAYGGQQVRNILGFDDLTALTTRVRPHITQAKRDDGQQKNTLGSASIKKASWVPSEYLDKEQYKKMSEDLALDEILTDVARRMFLERLVCKDLGGGVPV